MPSGRQADSTPTLGFTGLPFETAGTVTVDAALRSASGVSEVAQITVAGVDTGLDVSVPAVLGRSRNPEPPQTPGGDVVKADPPPKPVASLQNGQWKAPCISETAANNSYGMWAAAGWAGAGLLVLALAAPLDLGLAGGAALYIGINAVAAYLSPSAPGPVGTVSSYFDVFNPLINLVVQLAPCPKIVTSLDPNDITAAPSGAGARGWTAPQPILYSVDFYNEPKATAPAYNVVVKLPLSSKLNPTTIQPGDSSFPGTQFTFDPATNMITWVLPNIDLPPDTKPPNGEAWVSFTVTPEARLKTGTAIWEKAQVFFDYNPPIDTPSVTQTIDATAPRIRLTIGKQQGTLIPLRWRILSSVPVALSEIYVSIDGKAYVPFAQTRSLSYNFHTKSGHKYRFFVQGQDVAGLSSARPPRLPA